MWLLPLLSHFNRDISSFADFEHQQEYYIHVIFSSSQSIIGPTLSHFLLLLLLPSPPPDYFFQGKNVRENKQSIVPNQKRVHTHRLHTHLLASSCLVFLLTSKSLCRQRKQSETDVGSWNLEAFWCTGDTDVGSKKFPLFKKCIGLSRVITAKSNSFSICMAQPLKFHLMNEWAQSGSLFRLSLN